MAGAGRTSRGGEDFDCGGTDLGCRSVDTLIQSLSCDLRKKMKRKLHSPRRGPCANDKPPEVKEVAVLLITGTDKGGGQKSPKFG